MRLLLLIGFCICFGHAKAQFSYEVKVVDASTGQAISNVSLQVDGVGRIFYSDWSGAVRFNHNAKNCRVHLRHLAYLPTTADAKFGAVNTVQLSASAFGLPIAEISESLPDTVFGSEEYHVADYGFSPTGMYLLTYEKEQRWKRENESDRTLYMGCRLIVLDSLGKEQHNIKVKDDALGFYDEYLDGVFLQFKNDIFHVHHTSHGLDLEQVDDQLFKEWIEPVIDSIGPYICFSNYTSSFPAFEYKVLDTRDTTVHRMRAIIDKEMMVQFRSEFKWMPTRAKLDAFKLERQTGVDKEIIAAYMTGFPESIYFESLYAPLFVHRDTVFIFDHSREKLYVHKETSVVDSLVLSYQISPSAGMKWQKQVLLDEEEGFFYALYSKGKDSYLARIDLRTGRATDRVKLHHPYPENIRIKGGMAYFIHRPFSSVQKRFLYKQRI